MKLFIQIFCVFFSLNGLSQLTQQNKEQLRTELELLVNELRMSKGLPALISSDTLVTAAELQSAYMAKNDVLTHDQKKSITSSPFKRVIKSGGRDFEIVGENVLFSTVQKFPLNKKRIKVLALEMFNSWKDSPGHYANMINPNYVLGDFAFAIKKTKAVFATQVFGRRGVQVEGQFSKNAWGIPEGADDCEELFGSFSNIVANMGNSIKVEESEVIFSFHNVEYIDRIFVNANDGMAIDIVRRSQFDCDKPNYLDFSPVHDGVLLEPLYRDEIKSVNRAQSEYRFIAPLGHIPESLLSEELTISIVLIKEGKSCKYIVPSYAPSKRYKLRPIEPLTFDPPNIALLDTGIIASQELLFDFERDIVIPNKYPVIQNYNHPVSSVSIISYSSVEGDSILNSKLHNSRAEKMMKYVSAGVKVKDENITIDAKENWETMRFQLNYFMADTLAVLQKDSLREIVNLKEESLPWDSLLFAQRKSIATINYYGEITDSMKLDEMLAMNLRSAIQTKNYGLANKALFEMYYNDGGNFDVLFENDIFEALKSNVELAQNSAALFSILYKDKLYETTQFLSSWIIRKDQLSNGTAHNIQYLYTLTGIELLRDWDTPSERLSNVIHPTKIQDISTKNSQKELILNLHLTYIQYFGQVNDGPGISKSFYFITDYFKKNQLAAADAADLALFFNSWSMYAMTIDFLAPMFEESKLNEEGIFILAQTMNKYSDTNEEFELYEKVHQSAVELNSKRWCTWLKQDFQILRNENIKLIYCDSCN